MPWCVAIALRAIDAWPHLDPFPSPRLCLQHRDPNAIVRKHALQLLYMTQVHGCVNPSEVVGPFVCSLADTKAKVRELAAKGITVLFEKYSGASAA